MSDISVISLEKNISIFKGLLPNASKMVEIFKEAEINPESTFLFKDWRDWSRFGTYVWQIGNNLDRTEDLSSNQKYIEEESIVKELHHAFGYATNKYLEERGLKVGDDWVVMGPSISKYDHLNYEKNLSGIKDLEMLYHTDYVTLEKDWPGNKFILTCTMYLNDDYEGGDITFRLPNKQIIDYKPKAGDVLVFPSGHPDLLSENGKYLHGVKSIKNSNKYLVRCFYQKPFAGNPEWLENEKKYGKDIWMKMEKERIEKENDELNKLYAEELSKSVKVDVDGI